MANDSEADLAGEAVATSTDGAPAQPGYPVLPPGYVWAYPPPPLEPEVPWKAPRWLRYATFAWIVVLLGLAVFYVFRGKPTVREQTPISNAQPVVDGAIRNAIAAAGSAPVISLSAFRRVSSCKITEARSGAEYQRAVDFYTAPGTEAAVLGAIAAGLPSSYHAQAGNAAKPALYADAGDFVAVLGSVPTPGMVEVRALTGCRSDDLPAPTVVVAPAGSPGTIGLRTALAALGGTGTTPDVLVTRLSCAGGGESQTVQADTSVAGPLNTKPPVSPVVSTASLVAYRANGVDMVLREHGGTVTVTATTRCGQ